VCVCEYVYVSECVYVCMCVYVRTLPRVYTWYQQLSLAIFASNWQVMNSEKEAQLRASMEQRHSQAQVVVNGQREREREREREK